MLERGTEQAAIQPSLPATVIAGRFARDLEHFSVRPQRRVEAIVESAFAAALDDEQ